MSERNYQLLLDRMFQVMRDDYAAARWVRQQCRPTAVIDAFNEALFDGAFNTPRADKIFSQIAQRYCATFDDASLSFSCRTVPSTPGMAAALGADGTVSPGADGTAASGTDGMVSSGDEGAQNRLTTLADATLVMKVADLGSPHVLSNLLDDNRSSIECASKLIVDLRETSGDCEEAYFPLLPLLVDAPCNLMDLMGSRKVYTNFSENNCRRKIEMLDGYRSQIAAVGAADAADALSIIDALIADFDSRRGSGIVLEDEPGSERFDKDVTPWEGPAKVIVLIDSGCKGAGEYLARLCKRIEVAQGGAGATGRIMTAGRPTEGTTVGSDPVMVALDEDCTFTYPMSVVEGYIDSFGGNGSSACDAVKVVPTVALPRTPDSIVCDLDCAALL